MTEEEGMRHVPTVPELAKVGKARHNVTEVMDKNGKMKKTASYTPTPEGQQEIYDAMKHNAEYLRRHPEVSSRLTREAIARAKLPVD